MTRADWVRFAAVGAATLAVVGIWQLPDPAPAQAPTSCAPTAPCWDAATECDPHCRPATYPAHVRLPDSLAHAIGHARARSELACPGGKASAWVEIDETGQVVDIVARCAP